ncbi:30S ribosomal protein S6 [Candidatus Beckwithbacteria bacterium CG22_combo_CG10-13_8_21_14_all_01_47_9]|uniref:Small ribosomal subunit protein bS6 n=4 Tax=Candidatus Beckwithiibacteriota TaxID=1752726 RepID=A0A2H0DZT2_9BACT|nr:MAG: 30S ribosomal protein S6 [Candidatus Beckwithbacteria bacterium CG1_02_47_37]PIP87686.1 MAG: 30S ribosomal protein S6 [Candidatus Beckwithbacteria bacterium CG22_combo_CG10-13_8_21_14_all_01_47_9]PJA22163.1 MAG: 30S ribosomal protein S6 [Candidatus Beckwithbacteria bacterium CG_4_10_14_0_2_um_filter_47_25]PJC66403.1 MAG: 30S ribosomal protein S6 [Candidatus Beckwithbacteria bacterium CG_4_9_14_0_2_um_filter_47_11]
MSLYELTLVLKEGAKVSVPGKVKTTKDWGVRDLAYPIKGVKRGAYIWQTVELEPDQVAGLDKDLRQNELVLRHLLISQ